MQSGNPIRLHNAYELIVWENISRCKKNYFFMYIRLFYVHTTSFEKKTFFSHIVFLHHHNNVIFPKKNVCEHRISRCIREIPFVFWHFEKNTFLSSEKGFVFHNMFICTWEPKHYLPSRVAQSFDTATHNIIFPKKIVCEPRMFRYTYEILF
jgi:hypothetical protein